MLDNNLEKYRQDDYYEVERAIRESEWHFENEFDVRGLTKQIEDKGWSLSYIYLDTKKNRY